MVKTNVYIVGSGGREAMQAWMLKNRSDVIGDVFVGPGNGGTEALGAIRADVTPDLPRCERFIPFLKDNNIGLVLTGSENDLALGLADVVRMHRIPIIGASSAATRFESSKILARQFMAAHNVPRPEYAVFDTEDAEKNRDAAASYGQQMFDDGIAGQVIKADGLCGGKGVKIARNMDEFHAGLDSLSSFSRAT